MAKCPFQSARLLRFFRPPSLKQTFSVFTGKVLVSGRQDSQKYQFTIKKSPFERDGSLRIQANKHIEELESDKKNGDSVFQNSSDFKPPEMNIRFCE